MTRLERLRHVEPRSYIFSRYNKTLQHLIEVEAYSYQECLANRGQMQKYFNKRKKKK